MAPKPDWRHAHDGAYFVPCHHRTPQRGRIVAQRASPEPVAHNRRAALRSRLVIAGGEQTPKRRREAEYLKIVTGNHAGSHIDGRTAIERSFEIWLVGYGE